MYKICVTIDERDYHRTKKDFFEADREAKDIVAHGFKDTDEEGKRTYFPPHRITLVTIEEEE